MPEKRVEATVDGRRIVAVNTWFSGEWLEVDGVVVQKDLRLVNTQDREPMLEAVVVGDSGRPLHIEVFIVAIIGVRMMIMVNGVRVAGDAMHKEEEAAARRAAARLAQSTSSGGSGTPVAVPVMVGRPR
jgi:hypothetical protein